MDFPTSAQIGGEPTSQQQTRRERVFENQGDNSHVDTVINPKRYKPASGPSDGAPRFDEEVELQRDGEAQMDCQQPSPGLDESLGSSSALSDESSSQDSSLSSTNQTLPADFMKRQIARRRRRLTEIGMSESVKQSTAEIAWYNSLIEFRTTNLIKAIENDRVEQISEFASSDFAHLGKTHLPNCNVILSNQ